MEAASRRSARARLSRPRELAARVAGRLTHRLTSLPVLVLMPHGGCNCRCVMCDIWKANREGRRLAVDELVPHVESLAGMGVRQVVLSGGEPLMHPNLWRLCRLVREELGATITLLSTGLLLRRHAGDVVRHAAEVIVSLDGPPAVHDRIRAVPRAFARLADGVAALREIDPGYRVSGRCVVQRANFRHLGATVDAARNLGLDAISFLAADSESEAFARPGGWGAARVAEVALDRDEARELVGAVEALIAGRAEEIGSGFVVESPAKLRALARHFLVPHGEAEARAPRCNAPWVSAVVEADGAVRPCFFHPPIGHLDDGPLAEVVGSPAAVAFRRRLDVARDPVCRRCVCALHLPAWRWAGAGR